MAPRSSLSSGETAAAREVEGMLKIIKKDRREKDRAIIAVVRPESVDELKDKTGPSKLKFWRGKTPIRISTAEDLQQSIAEVAKNKEECAHLSVLTSRRVPKLQFDAPSEIQALSILRCTYGPETSTKHQQLLIDSESTFAGVRLDGWQGEQHTPHELYLGDGICIEVGMSEGTAWADSLSRVTQAEKTKIYESVNRMYNLDLEQVDSNEPWWVVWKEPLASILGIIKGDGKSGARIKASNKGLYVQFQFGDEAMATVDQGLKVATIVSGVVSAANSAGPHAANVIGPAVASITSAVGPAMAGIYSAAGPAALLGVGVGAAIYFVPWTALFTWLKGVFARLWDRLCAIWKRLMEMLRRAFGADGKAGNGTHISTVKHPPPVLF